MCIRDRIKRVYKKAKMIVDPHTACGTFAADRVRLNNQVDTNTPIISLACAHPCKFPDAVFNSIGITPRLPEKSHDLLSRGKKSLKAPAEKEIIKHLLQTRRRN